MPASLSLRPWIRPLAAFLVLILAFAGAVEAKEKKKKKDTKQYTVTELVYKKITKAQEAMVEEQWDLAVEQLAPLERKADKGRLGDHERALVYQLLSAIAASQERYQLSIDYKEKCLAQDGLPEQNKLRVQFEVAQLHLALENYSEAVTALRRWFKHTNERSSQAYYLLAVAYYQQDKFDKALRPAKKAVAIAKKPTQSWLQMLIVLYLQEERYQDALPHVQVMVTHFPKKIYYTQLSAIYQQLDRGEEALAVMQLAHHQGFLTLDRELRRLAEMYLFHDLPYRAAVVLAKAIEEEVVEPDAKSLELLANSWLQAQERARAVDPLIRAAELSERGDIYVRLGQVYLEREDWGSAADALAKGLEREVRREGDARILLGITYYNQKKLKSARSSFRAAREFEVSKKPALLWIQMLDREEKRALQKLEAALETAQG